ncbi:MAG TPA: ABC transporter permease [Bryobacteraceae bacterium]
MVYREIRGTEPRPRGSGFQLSDPYVVFCLCAMETLLLDLRFALRQFKRNPAFSLTAILVIALGIGATTAVFSVVDRLLFRSLPYPESDRLLSVGVTTPIVDGEFLMANDYFKLREHPIPVFSAITSWTGVADCDLTEQNPRRLTCAQVESTFLPTFGIVPVLGRNFTNADDRHSSPKVALISYGLWKSRFAANPEAVGKTIAIDGVPTRILGVLPPDFELPNLAHADLVVPQALAIDHYIPRQSGRPLRVFARLKPGITVAQARQMAGAKILQVLLEWLPPAGVADMHTVIRSLRDYQIQDVKRATWILFGAMLAVLLIVCANVANLLLARKLSRERELATRAALGAGRGRLLSQALTESTALGVLGAVPGCALAWALLKLFQFIAPIGIPRLQQAAIDPRVLSCALAITLLSSLVFGLAPSFAGSGHTLKHFLASAQVAVSLTLLAVAGLLVASLSKLQQVNVGQAAERVVTADITVGPTRYPNSQSRQQFFETLAARLRPIPGIDVVAISDTVPPNGFVHSKPLDSVQRIDRPTPENRAAGIVAWRRISPEYFSALGIPLLEGRTFNREEITGKYPAVILSDSLARRMFPHENAIGRALHLRRDPLDFPPAIIVGVAANVPNNGLSQAPDPEYYLPRKTIADPNAGRDANIAGRSLHLYDGEASLIVRGSARSAAIANWIRTSAAALDRTVPVTIATVEQRIYSASERPRFAAVLLSLFALTGVVLAAGGLYGLISFLVLQRTREVGIRIAVGATSAQIIRLILSHAMRWTLAGVAAGLIGAAVAARSLRSLLFEVRAENPALFAVAALVMLVISAAAALAPSLRAARVDPMIALRHE